MNDEQDITFDTEEGIDDSVLSEEAQGDTIKKLKTKLKEAEAKAKENLDGWQRAQADFLNLRKKDEEAKGEFSKFAKADFLSSILPVLDSMNLALSHDQKDILPIYNQFMNILKQIGLEEINPLNEPFEPARHEALSMVSVDDESKDHTIVDVLQKGYSLGDKVLRPAKVRVGEYKK